MQKRRILNIPAYVSMDCKQAMEMFLWWKKAQELAEYVLYQYRKEIKYFYTTYNLAIEEDPQNAHMIIYPNTATRTAIT